MLGTLVHVGGPAPLRAGVTYSYPFEPYAAHLPAWPEHALRLPWVQRHAFDDVGDVEHGEQESFVVDVLTRAQIPRRTGAPGEHVFPTLHEARCAAAALSAALGVPWGLTFEEEDRVISVELGRPTPALVVRGRSNAASEGASREEAVLGLDVLATERGRAIALGWVAPSTLAIVEAAMRAAPPRTPATPGG